MLSELNEERHRKWTRNRNGIKSNIFKAVKFLNFHVEALTRFKSSKDPLVGDPEDHNGFPIKRKSGLLKE